MNGCKCCPTVPVHRRLRKRRNSIDTHTHQRDKYQDNVSMLAACAHLRPSFGRGGCLTYLRSPGIGLQVRCTWGPHFGVAAPSQTVSSGGRFLESGLRRRRRAHFLVCGLFNEGISRQCRVQKHKGFGAQLKFGKSCRCLWQNGWCRRRRQDARAGSAWSRRGACGRKWRRCRQRSRAQRIHAWWFHRNHKK